MDFVPEFSSVQKLWLFTLLTHPSYRLSTYMHIYLRISVISPISTWVVLIQLIIPISSHWHVTHLLIYRDYLYFHVVLISKACSIGKMGNKGWESGKPYKTPFRVLQHTTWPSINVINKYIQLILVLGMLALFKGMSSIYTT